MLREGKAEGEAICHQTPEAKRAGRFAEARTLTELEKAAAEAKAHYEELSYRRRENRSNRGSERGAGRAGRSIQEMERSRAAGNSAQGAAQAGEAS